MRPEEELILCCSRTVIDSEYADRIKALLNERIDWSYVYQTALRHGVMPFLYKSIENTCPEAVPKSTMDQLREQYHANSRRNLFLTGELIKILHLFEKHKIKAVPFKGPAIASSIYANLALRQITDLDILVRKQDVLKAAGPLVSSGYKPWFKLPAGREEAYLKNQYELIFSLHDEKIIVELQWEIAPRYFNFSLAPLRLWEHVIIDDSGLPVIPPEDTLLILCVHGTKHSWAQLIWICDVAEIVRKGLDWKRVIDQAKSMGIKRILFLGLFIAKDLLNVSLPEKVLHHIEAEPMIKILARKVEQRMFRSNNSTSFLESCLFHLKAREHLRDRVRYCIQLTMNTTPRDWAFISLPPSLFFLYPLIRPIRLATKYGSLIMRNLLRDKAG
jgi:hypothetical protein